jgi:hypothetical protein
MMCGAWPETAKSHGRPSDRCRLGLAALRECVLNVGRPAPAEWQLTKGVQIVSVDSWRKELFRRGALDSEAANPRADFNRLKQALASRYLIGKRDGWVWPV